MFVRDFAWKVGGSLGLWSLGPWSLGLWPSFHSLTCFHFPSPHPGVSWAYRLFGRIFDAAEFDDAEEFDCRKNSRESSVLPVKVPRSCQESQVMSRIPDHLAIKPNWMLASSQVTR